MAVAEAAMLYGLHLNLYELLVAWRRGPRRALVITAASLTAFDVLYLSAMRRHPPRTEAARWALLESVTTFASVLGLARAMPRQEYLKPGRGPFGARVNPVVMLWACVDGLRGGAIAGVLLGAPFFTLAGWLNGEPRRLTTEARAVVPIASIWPLVAGVTGGFMVRVLRGAAERLEREEEVAHELSETIASATAREEELGRLRAWAESTALTELARLGAMVRAKAGTQKAETILAAIERAIASAAEGPGSAADTDPEALVAAAFSTTGVTRGSVGTEHDPDSLFTRTEATFVRELLYVALTNVRQHSGATVADVEVRATLDSLTVVVEDSGMGIDPTTTARPDHGLGRVLALAAALDGAISWGHRPGGGTRVTAEMPRRRPA